MITGKTKSGFEFELDEATFDNMEILDALADIDDGNPLALSKACRKILGDEQRKRLYEHLRTDSGRVPVQAAGEAITEIIAAAGDKGKN